MHQAVGMTKVMVQNNLSLSFPLSRAACGAQEREEAGDTPATPAKGWLPFAIPLERLIQRRKVLESYLLLEVSQQ